MVRTGAQYYPPASRSYWYEDSYPGTAMEANCCGWHSTEGRSLPSYGGGASAPTLTALPDFANRRLRWYQHFRIDTSARSFANKAGGVETNTANCAQVEIVGTCDRRHASTWTLGGRTYWAGVDYLYMGALPDWVVRDLAEFAEWLHDEHGVPLTSGLRFPAYPESYGAGNGVRMSAAEWRAFTGHFGHMHVPENDHGDPGAFPMAPILTRAKGEEEDMPLTDADAKKVLTVDGVIPNSGPDKATNPYLTLAQVSSRLETLARRTETKVDTLSAANAELVRTVALLAAGLGDLDPAAVVAELRAALESIDIRIDVPDTPAS